MRVAMQHNEPGERTFGPYGVSSEERVLRYHGNPVALAPKVVATLVPFLESPGRVISKAELMERIWPGDFVDDANLTQNIYVLRRLFEEHRSGVRIDNVPKRGYRLTAIAEQQVLQAPVALAPLVTSPSAQRNALLTRLGPVAAAVAIAALLSGFGGGSPQRNPYDLPARALQHYLLGQDDLRAGTPQRLLRGAASFAALVRERPE